jgi:hypothetical protein
MVLVASEHISVDGEALCPDLYPETIDNFDQLKDAYPDRQSRHNKSK